MKKVYLTIGVVLLLASLSALAIAEPDTDRGRRSYGPMGPGKMHRADSDGGTGHGLGIALRLKEELGLDAKQVEQLKAIKNDVKGQFKANSEAVKAKKAALNELTKSGASESEIRAAAGEIGDAIGDQAVLKVSTKAKVDAILTSDQKAKLQELKEQREKGRKWHRGDAKQATDKDAKLRRGPGKKLKDPESAFARIDTDDDGAISQQEFENHMEQMKKRRGDTRPRNRARPRSERPADKPEN